MNALSWKPKATRKPKILRGVCGQIAIILCVSVVTAFALTPENTIPPSRVDFLSVEERSWLRAHPEKLTLFFNTEFPPIEFISESGSFTGMGADVISRMEELLGVDFIKTPLDDWNKHLSALKSGECAIAPTIVRTDEREEYAVFTIPYATVPVVIITTRATSKKISLDDLAGRRVGVVSGYATETYLQEMALNDHFDLVTVANVAEGLQRTAFGQIDAFVENLAVAAYYIELEGIPNLRVAGTTDYAFAWCIGVSRKYPLLFSTITKALKNIPTGEMANIRKKWIAMEVDFKMNPKTRRNLILTALFTVLLIAGLTGITIFLKLRLNQKIAGLKGSEEKYRLLFDNAVEGVFQTTPDGRFLSANPSLVNILGFHSSRELFDHFKDIGKQHYLNTKDRDTFRQIIETNGVANAFEVQLLRRDGTPMWASIKARSVRDETGTIHHFDGFLEDITERKHVEKALRESEERYRTILNEMLEGYHEVDLAGNFTFFNEAFLNLFGYSRDEMMGTSFSRYAAEEAVAKKLFHNYNEMFKTEIPIQNIEWDIIRKDGERITLEFYASIVRDSKGIPTGFRGIVRDITDRKRAEKALQESETKFRSIFENKGTAIGVYGKDSIIRECNTVFEELSGYSKFEIIEKKKWFDFVVNEDLERMKKYHAQRSINGESPPSQYECGIIHRSGEVRTVIININLVGADRLVSLTDISARKLAEEEQKKLQDLLTQAQKMESIGTLAGGIAHDFNNILFPILGYADILLMDIPEDSPSRDSVDKIHTSALRAKDLVRQILTFSRQETGELILMKMQPIIKEALKLIRSTIPTTIEIKQDISPVCDVIKADPTQIHQIVMNLATNAYHAMEETGGELNVGLKQMELGTCDLINPDMTSGQYACLTVADTGIGMDKKLTQKIFDPFFTTKAIGKGTGMGLSVVHGIVKKIGGSIHVYSESGKGTEFKAYFPIEKSSFEKQNIQTKEPIQGGTERILLVDDEDVIIAMEKRVLERLGYQVTSRASSIEALEAFRAAPDKFDLIITDMAMPNMPGDILSTELIKIRSDIPILLCTGFSETMSEEKAASLGIKGFLLKPVVMKDFAQKIRELMDENSGSL